MKLIERMLIQFSAHRMRPKTGTLPLFYGQSRWLTAVSV
jgi:hypothetical protein